MVECSNWNLVNGFYLSALTELLLDPLHLKHRELVWAESLLASVLYVVIFKLSGIHFLLAATDFRIQYSWFVFLCRTQCYWFLLLQNILSRLALRPIGSVVVGKQEVIFLFLLTLCCLNFWLPLDLLLLRKMRIIYVCDIWRYGFSFSCEGWSIEDCTILLFIIFLWGFFFM